MGLTHRPETPERKGAHKTGSYLNGLSDVEVTGFAGTNRALVRRVAT